MQDEILAELENILKKDDNVSFAYIFGSYADGSFKDWSDVDIAVYLKETGFNIELTLHHEITKTLNKNIDMTVLNKAKNLYLLDDILHKGILLKDSEKRIDFELKKHHQILDYKEFKKSIDAA